MRDSIKDFFIGGEVERKNFLFQLRTLIVVAAGFTIAFTWRQTIFDMTQETIKLFLNINGSTVLSILTSTAITLLSILSIYLASRFIK